MSVNICNCIRIKVCNKFLRNKSFFLSPLDSKLKNLEVSKKIYGRSVQNSRGRIKKKISKSEGENAQISTRKGGNSYNSRSQVININTRVVVTNTGKRNG